MLLLTVLGIIAIGLLPTAYLIGQLTGVRAMARYYGKPQPDWIETIGLQQAARRGEKADAES